MKAEVLRQAVARIIDSDSIVREIIKEPALPMPGTVPQWSPFYNRQTPIPRYDPARAMECRSCLRTSSSPSIVSWTGPLMPNRPSSSEMS